MSRLISPIWGIQKNALEEIVLKSKSISEVLRNLGFKVFTGSTFYNLKSRLQKDNIDFSHIPSIGKGNPFIRTVLTKEEVISKWFRILNVRPRSQILKHYIFKFNLLDNKCCICANAGVWLGKPISIQLDHINGDGLDNRLENLRLLCPNCHSQTETFCGRKNRKNRKKQKIYLCPDCSVIYGGKGKRCRRCANKNIPHRPKIIWPSKDELEKLAMEKPMVKIAQELGIGGTCLRKKI